MSNKLTVKDLIARAEGAKKRKAQQVQVFVKSLGGNITIAEPDRDICLDAVDLEDGGDTYLVASVIVEPNIKDAELMAAYGANTPKELVNKLFKPGEITFIAKEALTLAGYSKDSVKLVEEVKN